MGPDNRVVTNMPLRKSLLTAGKRVLNNLPIYNTRYLAKAVGTAMEFEKMRRGIVTQQVIESIDRILEQPAPYVLLKRYANRHPFLRVVHGAILREVVKHGWDVKEKFAKKCTVCGQEFEQPVEQCPDCLEEGFLRDPNPQEKKRLQAFLEDPNRDDELIDIIKGLLKDELALDDWYVSIVEIAAGQFAIYNEDGAEMYICANKHGRLGNGQWFCPKCWSTTNEKIYQAKGFCEVCGKLLKETCYVQKQEGTIKARFGRDEIIHGSADKWLPHQYGNSKILAVLVELRSAIAMNSYNFDLYTSGHLAKLVIFPGMKQEDATKIAKAVREQADKIEIDQWTGRVGRKTRNLFLGGTEGAVVTDVMPDSQKMQSIDWLEFWFVKIVGAIYGVQPIMMNAPTRGPGGYFQRMQIIVQNDTSEGHQQLIEDHFNNTLVPLLGIHDWLFKFNPIEPRNEMEESQIWQVKIAAGTSAVQAGLNAEITEEGELKISGKFVKPTLPPGTTHTLHQVPETPKPPVPKQNVPFSMDKKKGNKRWLVTELDGDLVFKQPVKDDEGHLGVWRTIRGTPVFIREGETMADAFERQTGKKLGEKEVAQRPELVVGWDIHSDEDQKFAQARLKTVVNGLPDTHLDGIKAIKVHNDLKYRGKPAAGLYYKKLNRIEVDFRYLKTDYGRDTVYHEVGHHVYDDLITKRQKDEWRNAWWEADKAGKLPTKYAETSSGEGFAEGYMDFYGKGKRLDKKGKMYKYFQNVIDKLGSAT